MVTTTGITRSVFFLALPPPSLAVSMGLECMPSSEVLCELQSEAQARMPIKHFRWVHVNDWMRTTDPMISRVTLTDCGKESERDLVGDDASK
ncbi:hypothetical protein BZA77DRAFT_299686 [Pyronema omphalodes]|nr:hypothetical protein BZA77DRAFT_299686 [Pyronema omphalodes]